MYLGDIVFAITFYGVPIIAILLAIFLVKRKKVK